MCPDVAGAVLGAHVAHNFDIGRQQLQNYGAEGDRGDLVADVEGGDQQDAALGQALARARKYLVVNGAERLRTGWCCRFKNLRSGKRISPFLATLPPPAPAASRGKRQK